MLQFPSLSWLDADRLKAFSGIEELVADVVADMISNNEKVLHHSPGKYSRQFVVLVLSGSTKTSPRSRRTWRGHKLFSISKKSDVILVRVSDRAGTYASYLSKWYVFELIGIFK